MPACVTRQCPKCGETKRFRKDQQTCGCKRGYGNVLDPSERNEIAGNKWIISLPKTRIHTLEELIAYCQIDLSSWEVERFICNKWEVGMRPLEGTIDPIVTPLFQVKAFLRKKQNIEDAKREIEELRTRALTVRPVQSRISKANASGNLLEIGIPDHHFGQLAWGEETGGGNYDVKIAKDIFNQALYALIDRVKEHKFESVLFALGNDLLNADNIENQTTFGTPQTTDGRYQKTFATVRDLTIDGIERLRLIAPVKVVMVPGNHDRLSVWHLGDSLQCWFHNYKDVEIDNRPLYRKYFRFGSVMLMFTHGDKSDKAGLPLLMATEQPEMFGQTKFREIHTGHTHRAQMNETNGVRVRVLPSLCQPDDWHYDKGFVGNIRSAEAYVWNKDEGLIGTAVYTDIGGLK
jgi:hypothetical protein